MGGAVEGPEYLSLTIYKSGRLRQQPLNEPATYTLILMYTQNYNIFFLNNIILLLSSQLDNNYDS